MLPALDHVFQQLLLGERRQAIKTTDLATCPKARLKPLRRRIDECLFTRELQNVSGNMEAPLAALPCLMT